MPSSSSVYVPTHHADAVHDAQLDYYGLRLATCSSDRIVKVFNVNPQGGAQPSVEFAADLAGHTGPVWEVSWGPAQFGIVLASCSYDG
jgi:protein transport protein SEC13